MSEPKSAAGEQVYAAEPLQSKETCVSKKEVRALSAQDLSTHPHKRLRTTREVSIDPAVSPTASAAENLLQIAEQPRHNTLHAPLTELEYDQFITKLKRTCFDVVPRSKYIRLKKELVKIREDIARFEAQTKKARDAASKSLANQKRTEKQLQSYVEYVRKLRAVPAPA
ncbi:hypothetical protein CVIRNUC_003328 [Coccomyxa viridis]|uniref:Uncharacterized protein n=1 Tax=Coccomyxa viridis TaxID=1274662 RepID=A0AAV1HYQ3_9CHLO|nr:hypothetical protein CVIRNUC_003328 [Coccomyxa viridis]